MIDSGVPGVVIRERDDVPFALDGATRVGPHSVARPGALLRIVAGTGRFLARDGALIDYCAERGANADAVAAILEGSVLGAIIHQRGELPLHASTLVAPGGRCAIAVAGESGSGKSTTAYDLIRRGWTLLSDDLTRVTIADGVALGWPGRAKLRLMTDACARFGLATNALRPAPEWPGKFVIDVPRAAEPVPIRALISLSRRGGGWRVVEQCRAAAVRVLAEQTYRLHYVAALGMAHRHLALVTRFTDVARVVSATGAVDVDRVIEEIVRLAVA